MARSKLVGNPSSHRAKRLQFSRVTHNGWLAEARTNLRSIFSIHAGEYLVGTHIEENYPDLNVWLPAKDTGVDLLVTDKANTNAISLQVKFSKDFLGSLGKLSSEAVATKIKSGGWWTFNQSKLKGSKANLWVLVLYRFTRKDYDFVIIEPQELLKRYLQLEHNKKMIHSYIWVTSSEKCWETRGLTRPEQDAIAFDKYTNPVRDLSWYLNNWEVVEQKLKHNSRKLEVLYRGPRGL